MATNKNYFFENDVEKYIDRLNDEFEMAGFFFRASGSYTKTIEAYKIGSRVALKNLQFAIASKSYIDWGCNDQLKDKFESRVLEVINQ